MNTKIAILTSGHSPFDERLFYKIAHTLNNNNFETSIFCSTLKIDETADGIIIKGFDSENLTKREKINKFSDLLIEFKPDIIICAEILPIIAANNYKKELNRICKIIYDLTEWYPENYYSKLSPIVYYTFYPFFYLFQYYAIQKVDGIIFGEKRKIKRFNFLAPTKKKKHISYYPVLKYFDYSPPQFNGKELTLCFSGILNEDRGILRFINLIDIISVKKPDLNFKVKLIGRFIDNSTKEIIDNKFKNKNNCKLEIINWQPYNDISKSLSDVHICFDLRTSNFIYNNSLPIKIFEYMACGKPVIYSDIPAIRDLFNDDHFGYFVNPENQNEIIDKIKNYIHDNTILERHSKNGRKLVEDKYNWESLENDLIGFIREI